MIRTFGNHAFTDPPIKSGDTVLAGNFMQHTPGTVICEGVEGVTVEGGLFVNCLIPDSWIWRHGNNCQIEFCANRHPEMVAHGLPAEPDDCPHRSPTMVDVEVSREDAVKLKTGLKPFTTTTRKDGNGLDETVFTETKYVYTDRVLKPKIKAKVGP